MIACFAKRVKAEQTIADTQTRVDGLGLYTIALYSCRIFALRRFFLFLFFLRAHTKKLYAGYGKYFGTFRPNDTLVKNHFHVLQLAIANAGRDNLYST